MLAQWHTCAHCGRRYPAAHESAHNAACPAQSNNKNENKNDDESKDENLSEIGGADNNGHVAELLFAAAPADESANNAAAAASVASGEQEREQPMLAAYEAHADERWWSDSGVGSQWRLLFSGPTPLLPPTAAADAMPEPQRRVHAVLLGLRRKHGLSDSVFDSVVRTFWTLTQDTSTYAHLPRTGAEVLNNSARLNAANIACFGDVMVKLHGSQQVYHVFVDKDRHFLDCALRDRDVVTNVHDTYEPPPTGTYGDQVWQTRAWREQETSVRNANPGALYLPLYVYSDATCITLAGRTLKPVWATFAGLSRHLRTQHPYCIAFIDAKLPVRHAVEPIVQLLLKPLADGVAHPLEPAQRVVAPLFMVEGDRPEQNQWMRLFNNACRMCFGGGTRDDGTAQCGTPRTIATTLAVDAQARALYNTPGKKGAAAELLQQHQQHAGISPLLQIPHFYPYLMVPSCPGHSWWLGTAKDFVVWTLQHALELQQRQRQHLQKLLGERRTTLKEHRDALNSTLRHRLRTLAHTHFPLLRTFRADIDLLSAAECLTAAEVATLVDVLPFLFHHLVGSSAQLALVLHSACSTAFTRRTWTRAQLDAGERVRCAEERERVRVSGVSDKAKRHDGAHWRLMIEWFANLLNSEELIYEHLHQRTKHDTATTSNRQQADARTERRAFQLHLELFEERAIYGDVLAAHARCMHAASTRPERVGAQRASATATLAGLREWQVWSEWVLDERTAALLHCINNNSSSSSSSNSANDAEAMRWQPRCAVYTTAWLENADVAVRSTPKWFDNARHDDVLVDAEAATRAGLASQWAHVELLFACTPQNATTSSNFALVRAWRNEKFLAAFGAPLLQLEDAVVVLPLSALRDRVLVVPASARGILDWRDYEEANTTHGVLAWWVAHGPATFPHDVRDALLSTVWQEEWSQIVGER